MPSYPFILDSPNSTVVTYQDYNGSYHLNITLPHADIKLNDEDKEKIRLLDDEMSTLSPQFSNNNLSATNAYEMWLDEDDLDEK